MYDTKNEAVWSDIHDVSDAEWQSYQGKVDAIVGGSPCQAFSISGKRLGFNDPKGETFFQYVRALKNVKPSVFLFENVLGLLNHVTLSSLERVLPMLENDSSFVPNMADGSLHYHNLSIYQENDLGKSEVVDEYLKNPTVQKRLKKRDKREKPDRPDKLFYKVVFPDLFKSFEYLP
jgi:site-specific DNA-cytosine methylase